MKRFLLSVAALALTSSCVSTGPVTESDIQAGSDARLFADYLVGSYANYIDDAESRSTYYSRAFALDETNTDLGRRAVTSAITAGDVDLSRVLARNILSSNPNEPMSRAVLGAKAFAQGQYDKANEYFELDTNDLSVKILMDIMRGWSLSAQGNSEAAAKVHDSLGGGPYFQVLALAMQTNMAGPQGDIEKAMESYDLAAAAGVAPTEIALSRARLLSQAAQNDKALELLKKFNTDNGNFDSGPIRHYIDVLEAGGSITETLTPQQEAAWALTEAAYGFFLRNRAVDVAEVYLRQARILDPDSGKIKYFLAALLEETEREQEALSLYQSIDDNNNYVVAARLAESNVYFDLDQDGKAMAVLEETNAKYPSFTTRESLGRARLIRENYKEALPIYIALVDSMTEEEIKANTQPLYFRGISYEREKQWDKAVADFKKVLEIDPDNADALNYLGYTWVDRGENLTEAFNMIEKAIELEPRSGAIVDSLGWAHYKLGQYSEARVNLEKAVELTPNSATIIDHLGDVYWKLGRFREAGYQWERALEYDPTEEERKNIEAKLKDGLKAAHSK